MAQNSAEKNRITTFLRRADVLLSKPGRFNFLIFYTQKEFCLLFS
jgi:hypothetical protein